MTGERSLFEAEFCQGYANGLLVRSKVSQRGTGLDLTTVGVV